MEQLWVNPVAVSSRTYRNQILFDGPVAYWRLDDTGLAVADFSGNGNVGTVVGGVAEGVMGAIRTDGDAAMAFDGLSGYVSVPDVAALEFAGVAPFSLEAWVDPASVTATGLVICKDSSILPRSGYRMTVSSQTVSISRLDVAGGGDVATSSAGSVAAGAWTHCAATYDGVTLSILVNGALAASTPSSRAIPVLNTLFAIGAHPNPGILLPFAGGIDEVAVYPYALTAAQALAHYNAALVQPGQVRRFGPSLAIGMVRVASELAPTTSPAPAGNAYVPAGWVLQMGDEGEVDTMLADDRSGTRQYRANITQPTVPYWSGGWPPDPLSGQPGHTKPTQ